MATQDKIALTSPSFAAESASFSRVVSKEQKKQEKEVRRLTAALKLVEEEIASAKNHAQEGQKVVPLQTGATNPSQGPSNPAFEGAMDSMVFALQMLQILLAKYNHYKAGQEKEISSAFVQLAQKDLQKIQEKLNEIKEKEKDQKTASFWEEAAEIVVGAATLLIGIATLQPEIMIMGVLSLGAAFGGFKALTNLLAEGLEGLDKTLGLSKEDMQIIAAVLICVIVVAVSIAICNPESATEETAEASTEVGEQVAEEGAEESANVAENSAQESNSTFQSVRRVGSKIAKPFARFSKFLGPRGRIAVVSLLTTLSNTGAVQKIVDAALTASHVSKKEQKRIDQYVQIALEIAAVIATVCMSFGALTSSASGAAKMTSTVAQIAKYATKLGTSATVLGLIGEAGASGYQGYLTIKEGSLRKALLENQASLELLNTLIGMNSSQMSEDQRHLANAEKNQRVGNKSITQLMKGIEGFANDAVYYSPV